MNVKKQILFLRWFAAAFLALLLLPQCQNKSSGENNAKDAELANKVGLAKLKVVVRDTTLEQFLAIDCGTTQSGCYSTVGGNDATMQVEACLQNTSTGALSGITFCVTINGQQFCQPNISIKKGATVPVSVPTTLSSGDPVNGVSYDLKINGSPDSSGPLNACR